jgi:SAM-dependent methyltransferase
MNKLDLGCGTAKVKNAIGVDKFLLPGVDVVCELDKYPYPFAHNVFDEVYLNDIIEHLPDTIKTMEEIYRICKPSAKVYIRTINWNSHYNAMDPTHVRTFHERSFDFYGNYPGRDYYSTARFDVISVKYGFNAQAKKLFRSEKLMKYLSHYLNNVLEDLHFELKAQKPGINKDKLIKSTNIIDLVRCPRCLGSNRAGILKQSKNYLICQEKKCKKKYHLQKSGILFNE